MRSSNLLIWFLAVFLFAGCSGIHDREEGEMLALLPFPRQVERTGGYLFPGTGGRTCRVSGLARKAEPVIFEQLAALSLDPDLAPEKGKEDPDLWIGIPSGDPAFSSYCEKAGLQLPDSLDEEGYLLVITRQGMILAATTPAGVFYGLQTLRQLWRQFPGEPGLPCMKITDWPAIPMRVVMDDISRGPIPAKAYIKEQVRRYSELKINHMSFYIEHVVKTESNPGFAPDGAISLEEFREISEYAAGYHIKVIGGFQSLGHFANILKVPALRHLGATDRMLDPLNPEAIAFLRDIYREMAPAFSSHIFNANCDEAWDLSRAPLKGEAANLGVARIYADHVRRIDTTLHELGKRTLIWGDIIMDYPEILDLLPKRILTGAWNYDAVESFAAFIDPLKDAGFDFTISPGILNSNRLFPDYRMTFTNIRNFIGEGYRKGTCGVFLTVWDDGGPHFFNHDWFGVAYAAEQSWRPDTAGTASFDRRFSQAFYGDPENALPRAVWELDQLTRLGPTYEMNELVFGKILIPAKGRTASFQLEAWEPIRKVAVEASGLLAEGSPDRYADDWLSLEFVCRQYIFMADARKQLFEAAEKYRAARAVGSDDPDKALSYLEGARVLIARQARSFEDLSRRFEIIWNLESRPYWYDVATAMYTRRNHSFAEQLSLLDKATAGFSSGNPLPDLGDVRLDIRQHHGQYFQYWLLCGAFPLSDPAGAGADFLIGMGGEASARPYPGMRFTDSKGMTRTWQKYDSPFTDRLDLEKVYPGDGLAVAYAYCSIDAPGDKLTEALIGSSDGVTIYCNGEKILEQQPLRELVRHEDQVMLPLKKGRNHLLLKIDRLKPGWEFTFRLEDEDIRNHKQKYYIQ
jgi:hexosaminidase